MSIQSLERWRGTKQTSQAIMESTSRRAKDNAEGTWNSPSHGRREEGSLAVAVFQEGPSSPPRGPVGGWGWKLWDTMMLLSAIHFDWSASGMCCTGSDKGNHVGWLGFVLSRGSGSDFPFTRIGTDAWSPEPGHTSDNQNHSGVAAFLQRAHVVKWRYVASCFW